MFAKANSLFGNVQGWTFPNNGIPAATENPQRAKSTSPVVFLHASCSFRTDTDVRESEQKRDLCYTQISTLSSVQGDTLLNKLFSKVLELRDTYGIAANKLIGDV